MIIPPTLAEGIVVYVRSLWIEINSPERQRDMAKGFSYWFAAIILLFTIKLILFDTSIGGLPVISIVTMILDLLYVGSPIFLGLLFCALILVIVLAKAGQFEERSPTNKFLSNSGSQVRNFADEAIPALLELGILCLIGWLVDNSGLTEFDWMALCTFSSYMFALIWSFAVASYLRRVFDNEEFEETYYAG